MIESVKHEHSSVLDVLVHVLTVFTPSVGSTKSNRIKAYYEKKMANR